MSYFIILTILAFYYLISVAIKFIRIALRANDKADSIILLFSVLLPMTLHVALGEDYKKTYANLITPDMVCNQYKYCKLQWPQIEVLHPPRLSLPVPQSLQAQKSSTGCLCYLILVGNGCPYNISHEILSTGTYKLTFDS